MSKIKILASFLFISLVSASPLPENYKRFSFDGLTAKHPVSFEMERVVYKAKQTVIYFTVTNNSNEGIDFSFADWKIHSDGRTGFVRETDFDGMRLHPKSKRGAKVVFEFDEFSKSGFLNERKKGTSTITIEGAKTFKNQKVAKITLKNF